MALTGLITGYLFTVLGVLSIGWLLMGGMTVLEQARQQAEQLRRDVEQKEREARRQITDIERAAPSNRTNRTRSPRRSSGPAYREPKLPLPDNPVKGRIGASDFTYEHALLENGWFTLRQGEGFLADVEVKIVLWDRNAEAEGKTYTVTPAGSGRQPHLHFSWQENGQRMAGMAMNKYTMTLKFEKFEGGQVKGTIDLRVDQKPAGASLKGDFVAKVK